MRARLIKLKSARPCTPILDIQEVRMRAQLLK